MVLKEELGALLFQNDIRKDIDKHEEVVRSSKVLTSKLGLWGPQAVPMPFFR